VIRQALLIASLALCLALGGCGEEDSPPVDPRIVKQAETTCGEYLKLSEGEKADLVRATSDPADRSGGIAYLVEGFTRACEAEDSGVTLLDVLVPPEKP